MNDDPQRGEGGSTLGYKDVLRVGPGTIGGTYLRRFWHPVFIARDIALIKRSGFNSVRVAFDYRLFVSESDPPRLLSLRPDVPPEVDALVRRMLAKDPADRFAIPLLVVTPLRRFCTPVTASGSLVRSASSPPGAGYRPSSSPSLLKLVKFSMVFSVPPSALSRPATVNTAGLVTVPRLLPPLMVVVCSSSTEPTPLPSPLPSTWILPPCAPT